MIFDCVRPGAKVADVGTDHAHIPIALIAENRADRVIAVDIKEGPLEIAKNNVAEYGFLDRIDIRRSDGLEAILPEEVDTVIIAGLGGNVICDILSRAIGFDTHDFILQPMTAQDELREFLLRNGYRIVRESLAKEEDKIYDVMIVLHEWEETVTEDDLYFHIGRSLIEEEDPLLLEFLDKKIRQLEVIDEGLTLSGSEPERLERVKALKEKMEEVRQRVRSE